MAYTIRRGPPEDARAILQFEDEDKNDARIERILVENTGEEEYRFSWWKNCKLMPRPLDLNEEHLIKLLKAAITDGVFRQTFLDGLRELL